MGVGNKHSYHYSYISEHIKNVLLYFMLKIIHFHPLIKIFCISLRAGKEGIEEDM